MKPFIVVGDKTSHGGVVVEGSPTNDIEGKPMARVGDKATCPKRGCPSTVTIVTTSDPTIIIDGKPAAFHGDGLSCGAKLIASQFSANSDPNGGGDSVASSTAAASGFLSQNLQRGSHDQHFVLTNNQTGEPLEHVKYKIHLADGRSFEGVTDDEGKTEKVFADSPLGAKIEVLL
jgi:uncharacterized Zn-binding protein involved in type VI secretion